MTATPSVILAAAAALLGSSVAAAIADRQEDFPLIASLPAAVAATPGKATLVVLPPTTEGNAPALYIINASADPFPVTIWDGRILFLAEARNEKGEWRRCTPFLSPECGNGLKALQLPPGRFLQVIAPTLAKKGKNMPVRFGLGLVLGKDLLSNEIITQVDSMNLEWCRYDRLALDAAPFEDLAAIVTGKVEPYGGISIYLSAISEIARFAADPRWLGTMKEAVSYIRQLPIKPGTSEMISPNILYIYTLKILSCVELDRHGDQARWEFIEAEGRDVHNPFRSETLRFQRPESKAKPNP
jgi:hypothetical protein